MAQLLYMEMVILELYFAAVLHVNFNAVEQKGVIKTMCFLYDREQV